jgi:hypothetical protein
MVGNPIYLQKHELKNNDKYIHHTSLTFAIAVLATKSPMLLPYLIIN